MGGHRIPLQKPNTFDGRRLRELDPREGQPGIGSAEIVQEVTASTPDIEHRELLSLRQGALGDPFEELDIRVLEPPPVLVLVVAIVVRLGPRRVLQDTETMRAARTR